MSRYETDRYRDENGEAIFYPDEEGGGDSPQYSIAEQQYGEANHNQSKTKPRMRTKPKSSQLSTKRHVNAEDQDPKERNLQPRPPQQKPRAPQQKPRELSSEPKIKPRMNTNPKTSLLSINRLVSVDDDDGNNDSRKRKPKPNPKRKRIEKTNSLDEDEEISKIRSKKPKKSEEEKAEEKAETTKKLGIKIEEFIAKLEATAQEDAELNRKGKPAIRKLLMLGEMKGVLCKKPLHAEFIQRGGLSALKAWLEPLPTKCLPHVSIRSTVLKVVEDLNLDIEDPSVREQLKQSRLGHVINFLSKSGEEVPENKRLALHLIQEWSRVIYGNTNDYAACPATPKRPPIPRTIVKNCRGTASRFIEKRPNQKNQERDREIEEDTEIENSDGVPETERVAIHFKMPPTSKIQVSEVKSHVAVTNRRSNLENRMKKSKINKKVQRPVKFNISKAG